MHHDPRQIVLQSLPVFLAHPQADWPTLVRLLQSLGWSAALAQEVGAFVPIAFGRLLLYSKGIYADPRCARLGTQPLRYQRLDELPIYRAALDLARELFLETDQLPYKQYILVAGRSSELNMADRMLDEGSHPGNIMIGPALITVPGIHEFFADQPIDAEIIE